MQEDRSQRKKEQLDNVCNSNVLNEVADERKNGGAEQSAYEHYEATREESGEWRAESGSEQQEAQTVDGGAPGKEMNANADCRGELVSTQHATHRHSEEMALARITRANDYWRLATLATGNWLVATSADARPPCSRRRSRAARRSACVTSMRYEALDLSTLENAFD